jgi:histidinol-phosphate aminotransferase
MNEILSTAQQSELLTRGFSRRSFGKFASLLAAGAALPFYNEPALAQLSNVGPIPSDAVKINANENPLGPCSEAADAIHSIVQKGGRYLYEDTSTFVEVISSQEGLKSTYVLPFAGSSDPLHRTVLAFTSPTKSFVAGDPGYEAGFRAADFVGAKTIKIPLTSTYAHDVRAMAAADPNAGVFYVCNPNNPTGTLTSRADVEWLLANKPKGSIVLLDEAYMHFSDSQPASDLVAADKDLIILRTFSKLYGMAGLRAGAAFGRPDLLAKIQGYSAGALPITAMVGATASLQVKSLIAERKKNMRAIREDVFAFLSKNNISFVPSDSNCFMLDTKRPAGTYVKAMQAEKVYVGRVWPAWPTYSRITVGTSEEMAKFKVATLKVLA